jgi:glycosyltransferase involved in cell wall biosynthesis
MKSFRLGYLTVRYPVLSQTFLQREVQGLMQHGIEVHIFPCQQWNEVREHKGAKIYPLPRNPLPALWEAVKCLIQKPKTFVKILSLIPQYRLNSFENFLATVWGVWVGLSIAPEIRRLKIGHLHAAWATLPATATALASYLTGVRFSFGAHAYDLFRHGGDGFLKQKMQSTKFVHTSTEQGRKRLLEILPQSRVILARRGLPQITEITAMPFSTPAIRMLSVGRLVEKKGQRFQIEACRLLVERGHQIKLKIIGEGELRHELEKLINYHGLQECVQLAGALAQEEVQKAYDEADVFLHTGVVDSENDRDGLPNVIPEAMAHGIPVLSSSAGATTEAIQHEVTGWIIDPKKPENIVETIERIASDQQMRSRVIQNARRWVLENFDTTRNTRLLAEAFQEA